MSNEIELRLTLDPIDAARMARLPLLQRLSSGKPASRILKSIYYDTPNADLRSAQLTLRLRRLGRGWVQTIKEDGATAGGFHLRTENEQPVSPDTLDFSKVEDASLRKKVSKWHAAGELDPRFETVVRRTTWLAAAVMSRSAVSTTHH
jgi:inorganic triphosphatase YgiF